MAAQSFEVDIDVVFEFDADRVVALAGLHDSNVSRGSDDLFGIQEADSQLLVVTGRTHRNRHGLRQSFAGLLKAKPNLERLLDSDPVVDRFAQTVANPGNADCLTAVTHRRHFRPLAGQYIVATRGAELNENEYQVPKMYRDATVVLAFRNLG